MAKKEQEKKPLDTGKKDSRGKPVVIPKGSTVEQTEFFCSEVHGGFLPDSQK